jgi:uncharacterized protein
VYRAWKAVKLNYSDIPEGGLRIALRGEDGPWEGLKGHSVEALPSGHLLVQRRGQDVFVEGEVASTLRFACSRCLEGFSYPVEVSFRHMLRPQGKGRVETKEIELSPEDLEPMQPLCKEECRGLCPHCGTNRNDKDCKCLESIEESPFDCLKQFVVQKR